MPLCTCTVHVYTQLSHRDLLGSHCILWNLACALILYCTHGVYGQRYRREMRMEKGAGEEHVKNEESQIRGQES